MVKSNEAGIGRQIRFNMAKDKRIKPRETSLQNRFMTEESYDGPERRRFFRVEYPLDARPVLKIGKNIFSVLDISERGVRFLNDKGAKFADWVKGSVSFYDGDQLEFEGKIVWERDNELGVQIIVTPIPAARVLAEQRHLIARRKMR